MKAWIVLLLALSLAFPMNAALASEPQWTYDEDNMVLRLEGTLSGEVTIPSEADGHPVNAVESNAFYEQHDITSLTMPDSLRALSSGAVTCMDGLTRVTLNDGLEIIAPNFKSCSALTSLTIPASVRIVDSAIGVCENLKEICFEGECPLFLGEDWCFFMMPEDYTIYVPDDQLDAYAQALRNANGAAEHIQPSGKNAVLRETENNEAWFAFDASTGTITGYREDHAYVEIPASIGGAAVKAIGPEAFCSNYAVYGLVLPEGLETIGAAAFRQACNLSYVSFPTTLKTIGDEAFFNAQIDLIDWSEGLEEIGARAFQYGKGSVLTLPSTVRTIGESAFESAWCQALYLGSRVERIGPRAFAQTPLSYIAFDLHAPIDIAADAFADTHILDLDLPWDSSVENRDAYAALLREQCPDCTVWINNPIAGGVAEYPVNQTDVTEITQGVWTRYDGDQKDLTVWTDYDDIQVTALGDGVFKGNQTLRSFYPHHCGWFTTIGAEAFADSSVEYVELFPSVTTIGAEAFRNCVNITELTLPGSLTDIGAGAFRGCTGITELTLPASLTSIGEGALDGCERLARLTVLCDPAILPEHLLDECFAHTQICAAPDATNEQVALLSALAHRPWYAPVPRVGEPVSDLAEMPYAMLSGEDFWYDGEAGRLDRYEGYELNLVLPREIDGVALTRIGGSMMSRASYGDNFDVELPVRSLVIPETYTEIAQFALENCDTLETVICYAPIENLADNVFSGCTSLREVVFVNGVRHIGRYVFSDCPNLQTVYLGRCVESISEYAFLNEDGSEAFALADCITDPAQMPDVDALLAAVRSDPMPTPAPTATPVPAMPVGEAGVPYLGAWRAETMEMDGVALSVADMGLVMELTLNADGVASLYDGESSDAAAWTVEDGAARIDSSTLTLTGDGRLCMEEDGVKLYFVPDMRTDVSPAPEQLSPSAPADPGDAPDGASQERLDRKYVCTSADVDGFTIDASMLGGEYSLTFHGDGAVDFVMVGTSVPGLSWTPGTVKTDAGEAEAYLVNYYGSILEAVFTEEGFDMVYFDSMLMHFAPER